MFPTFCHVNSSYLQIILLITNYQFIPLFSNVYNAFEMFECTCSRNLEFRGPNKMKKNY